MALGWWPCPYGGGLLLVDPISPYLILLAVEGLSCLLKDRDQLSALAGLRVATLSAPTINHLLFADDSMLSLKATREGPFETMNVLDTYCNASGQMTNMDKSSFFFSNVVQRCLEKE
jgi:hypothetical protein